MFAKEKLFLWAKGQIKNEFFKKKKNTQIYLHTNAGDKLSGPNVNMEVQGEF